MGCQPRHPFPLICLSSLPADYDAAELVQREIPEVQADIWRNFIGQFFGPREIPL
jgi:hypothetical protein